MGASSEEERFARYHIVLGADHPADFGVLPVVARRRADSCHRARPPTRSIPSLTPLRVDAKPGGAMKMMLHHVTGSLRGRTQYFDADHVTFGIADTCGVTFDPTKDPIVAPVHADITVERNLPVLRDRSGHGAVLVNGQPETEATLHDGDQIRFGEQGPLMRFHMLPETSRGAKPWRDIVMDSRDILHHTPHRRYTSPLYLARTILKDIAQHGSRTVKLVALFTALVPLLVIIGLSVSLYRQSQIMGASQQRIAELLGELETGRLTQAELERRIAEERDAVAILRGEREELIATLRATLDKEQAARLSESELDSLRERLDELAAAHRSAEELISRFHAGVGLLQGGYELLDEESRRPLRYLGFDERGRPLEDEQGNLRLTLEGDTPPLVIYYAGTGFLVDAHGTMVTNRHLVRMWETYAPVQATLQAGYQPRLSLLRVFFPGIETPFQVRILALSDRVDLAILRTQTRPRGIPVLPLGSAEQRLRIGQPVLILSYPGTFDTLLSRLPSAISGEVLRVAGSDPLRLAEVLAQRNLIKPLSTHGYISDISNEVVTYEARSAGGSSGGAVFDHGGHVVAVNHAVIQRVAGVNLGVPTRLVHEMLQPLASASMK